MKLNTQLLTGIFLLACISFIFSPVSAQQNALNFDGINDHLSFDHTTLVLDDLTVSAWVQTTSSSSGMIVSQYECGNFCPTNSASPLVFLAMNGSGQPYFSIRTVTNPTTTVTGPTPINDGSWHHVAGVRDVGTGQLYLYVDGTQIAATTGFPGSLIDQDNSPDPYTIGAQRQAGTSGFNEHFQGSIDEVRLWSVARSATEIANTFCSQLSSSQTGLEAYFQFNQGVAGGNNTSIATSPDLSGNGRNATLNNMALNGNNSNFVVSDFQSSAPCQSVTVPTLSQWGVIILALGIVCIGAIGLWRRKYAVTPKQA